MYGKFVLCMLDLTQIELATEEDKSYGIDYWARLFKAETWEELKMIAKNDKYLMKASETLYSLHCDQTIQDMCCAREDYIRLHNTIDRKIADLEADNEKLSCDNEKLKATIRAAGLKLPEDE